MPWRWPGCTAGPYRLAVLVHVDDVFGEDTERGVTERDGWLCGPGIGDNAIAVATAVAVCEHARPGPLAVVFTVGEEGLGGLRGARHAGAGQLRAVLTEVLD
jgi:acetylornithine deacetylase/succinyl-diaminopimelate desuccinylase-like protein